MNFFKQRRNKTFRYAPKYQDETASKVNDDLEAKWQELRQSSKRKKNVLTSLPFMIIFLIMVLVLFYVLSRYE